MSKKINYTVVDTSDLWMKSQAIKYTLKDSILKTHFKVLMKISVTYNAKDRKGRIEDKKDAFFALVEKIEKSNSKRCKTSHEKAVVNAAKRLRNPSTCEHEDLGSRGHIHGTTVKCNWCGQMAEAW